jgi:PRTRC genetic system protein C
VDRTPFVRAHSVHELPPRRTISLTVALRFNDCVKEFHGFRQPAQHRRRTNNMAIKVERMTRDFVFNNIHLPDPNPELPIEKVREIHAMTYPEISTAAVEGPEILGNRLRYTFSRAVGTKG